MTRTSEKIKSKGKKSLVEVGKDKIDKITSSTRFEVPQVTGPQPDQRRQFFIFRWPGDSIEGVLGPPQANIRRNTSYPITNDEGTFEIFCNKVDHSIIKDNSLVGCYIRVEYVGYEHIPGVIRPRKVKRWYKAQGLELVQQYSKKYPERKRPGRKKQ